MSGRRDYRADDHSRGHAIGEILLKYDHLQLLGERADIKAEADAAQQALRRKLDATSRERDAVRRALDAERANRRRDRERHARFRDSLRGARNAVQRLGESRTTYRDLALRVEAALLRAVPRRDLGGLEGRLARALRNIPESRQMARRSLVEAAARPDAGKGSWRTAVPSVRARYAASRSQLAANSHHAQRQAHITAALNRVSTAFTVRSNYSPQGQQTPGSATRTWLPHHANHREEPTVWAPA